MSREVEGRIKVGVEGIEIAGRYKTEFSAPLILSPCQHHIEPVKKGLIRRKEWFRTSHGQQDGSVVVIMKCEEEAKRLEN